MIFDALLFVLGGYWCHEMWKRRERDLDEYRNAKDPSARQAVLILWIATGVFALLMLNFAFGILDAVGLF